MGMFIIISNRHLFVIALLLVLTGTASAIIEANSSDLMFLVNVSDEVNFTSNLTGTLTWTVNKVVQSNTTDGFLYVVPAKLAYLPNNIFEISATNGTNITEWLVSTLNSSESPTNVDYFVDLKKTGRTEKTPWNETAINWNSYIYTDGAYNFSKGYFDVDGTNKIAVIESDVLNLQRGTFRFRFFANDVGDSGSQSIGADFTLMNVSPKNTNQREALRLENVYDEHLWVDSINNTGKRHVFAYDGVIGAQGYAVNTSGVKVSGGWHTYTIIINENDEVLTYFDNNSIYATRGHLDRTEMDLEKFNTIQLKIFGSRPTGFAGYFVIDGIEIWNNTFLYPTEEIIYNSTTDEIEIKNGDVTSNTTLYNINLTLSNTSLFTYYSENNTYQAFKPIRVKGGGTLRIINETFIPYSYIFLNNTANIYIYNSTVTGNNYYLNYTCSMANEYPTGNPTSRSGHQNVTIINSTVNGSGFTQSSSFYNLNIQNSIFSNMITPFFVGQTSDQPPIFSFQIMNTSFNNTLTLNDINSKSQLDYAGKNEYMTFHDIYANISIIANGDIYRSSKAIFKNLKYDNISITNVGEDAYARIGYYADICINSDTGNPKTGTITISNQNDSNIKSLNLNRFQHWLYSGTTLGYERSYYQNDNISSIITDSSGHTPLPVGNESTTLLLMNMSKNSTATTYYSYIATVNMTDAIYQNKSTTIDTSGTITPLEATASAIITPTASWYRPNPNTYQNTTTITLPASTNLSFMPSAYTVTVNASSDLNFTATWAGSQTMQINSTNTSFINQTYNLTLIQSTGQFMIRNDTMGTVVDTQTGNATGFINFTYTGRSGTVAPVISTGIAVGAAAGLAISIALWNYYRRRPGLRIFLPFMLNLKRWA